ncbi:4-hydroxy-3-methylbut-2-enyl diphosphate reductase [Magnetococcus marinus MC-1]|uniref:4-hydroxy-3-methylbut-2-enyl diphosphate reductase n=1 Tax=Magnetococcus marinus (strain ATCC BAA-1437 / JCM 17883 / MC-1) TaxID=156889 RepID=ISPH_MAGMM|nr:RecName: Full=4-hydroxy-3-methylbut-2-enyl diphosphate reductase; Short=HMBPP reductase [Magnetococcus marinus MC-1]ABK45914.1 4-hydroxy-3-methylbut-2-enyl diphosphate reductase [Magnetococcus marinus MC-1]
MRILLAEPRGFCAGVDRAIAIVLKALEKFGPPIYVRHEIVHNRWVVEHLRNQGAVFVHELDEIPDGAVAIYSAHGVSKAVQAEGERRPLHILDATCPLVDKVHREAERLDHDHYQVLLIGHAGHPEVEGTMGQLQQARMKLISHPDDVAQLRLSNPQKVAYITQTTLSVDETRAMVAQLKARFPTIKEPAKEDICYATQNRQNAVKALAQASDLILVLGAPNSSNSNRLREVAEQHGCRAFLIENAKDVEIQWLEGVETLGITAGASAPEILVEELLAHLHAEQHQVELLSVTKEYLAFPLPLELRE